MKRLRSVFAPYHKAIAAFIAPILAEFALEVTAHALNLATLEWAAAHGIVYAAFVFLAPANAPTTSAL